MYVPNILARIIGYFNSLEHLIAAPACERILSSMQLMCQRLVMNQRGLRDQRFRPYF